jgi:hypothetical protein
MMASFRVLKVAEWVTGWVPDGTSSTRQALVDENYGSWRFFHCRFRSVHQRMTHDSFTFLADSVSFGFPSHPGLGGRGGDASVNIGGNYQ